MTSSAVWAVDIASDYFRYFAFCSVVTAPTSLTALSTQMSPITFGSPISSNLNKVVENLFRNWVLAEVID